MCESKILKYKIIISPSAKRDLDKLENNDYQRVFPKLLGLENDPRPNDCKKLTGGDREYRIRIGRLRVLYEINDNSSEVIIYRVLPRDKAYRL